ncbi:MAG: alpha-L-fucosidase, partial [Planctomycetota bacterium]|nr:alpha-L-fucosidase [Planctomycetota bacterium]
MKPIASRIRHVAFGCSMLLMSMVPANPAGCATETPRQDSLARQNERMAWWREARFGMFIHWGLYAIPAGTWNGESAPGTGEWIMRNAKIPVADYEKLLGQFDPVQFNAMQWARLAREARMNYVVITTKHHDGFCLFDSKETEYD